MIERRSGTSGVLSTTGAVALLILASVAPVPARAAPPASTDSGPQAKACAPFDHEHTAWTAILKQYVHDGRVDYTGLAKHGRPALEGYLHTLAEACPAEYPHWTRDQKLAYWINAYNAFTIQLILDHFPLDSIRSIGILPGFAFRDSFIHLQPFRQDDISLDDIENGILRGKLEEVRIHFAIVCASKSCPVLQSEAYRASDLDQQLDAAARRFVRDPNRNHYDPATDTLYLSSIFKWFRSDFEHAAGSLPAFVDRYADGAMKKRLDRGEPAHIEFLDYDWSLNGA